MNERVQIRRVIINLILNSSFLLKSAMFNQRLFSYSTGALVQDSNPLKIRLFVIFINKIHTRVYIIYGIGFFIFQKGSDHMQLSDQLILECLNELNKQSLTKQQYRDYYEGNHKIDTTSR